MKGIADKLTSEMVQEYHRDVLTHVNASLITIEDMQPLIDGLETLENLAPGPVRAVLELLKRFEIVDVVDFLKTTAIILPMKKGTFVYVPWVPGVLGGSESWALAVQVEIISHEGARVLQSNEDPNWLRDYLLKFAKRCYAERKAFQTSSEVFFLMHGFLPSVKETTGNLAPYFLRPTDGRVLRAGLEAVREPIENGFRSTPMGKFAAKWFGERIS